MSKKLRRVIGLIIILTFFAGLIFLLKNLVTSDITPSPSPKPQLSFIEKVSGEYNLIRWDKEVKPIVYGVGVHSGKLKIDKGNNADWDLGIWDRARYPHAPPANNKARTKCGGTVVAATNEIRWVPGGQRNVMKDWPRELSQFSQQIFRMICGKGSNFKINYEKDSNGIGRLTIVNDEGVFYWEKLR